MVLKQGDIIIVNLNPTKGREQQGRRPAVILSSDDYYRFTGLLIVSRSAIQIMSFLCT